MASSTAASSSQGKQGMTMQVNPRGIPRAPFVENVEEYVGSKDGAVEGIIKTFQETSSKYRYMELNQQQRRKMLQNKIPDMENTLRVVEFLQRRRMKKLGQAIPGDEDEDGDEDDLDDLDEDDDGEGKGKGKDEPLKSLFELNDTLYAEAEVEEGEEVGIWLGASTMLMYPLQEAIDLLRSKIDIARKQLGEIEEDLEWLKEQATVMDVNFARVHNWDVKRRRQQKLAQADTGKIVSSNRKEADEQDAE